MTSTPDIDPLPSISVIGFRNPGKDQQLELSLGLSLGPVPGCASRPGTPSISTRPELLAVLAGDNPPIAHPLPDMPSPLLVSKRHCEHTFTPTLGALWTTRPTRRGFAQCPQQSAGLSNQGPSTPGRCSSARAVHYRPRPGCWIRTSATHNRGTEPRRGRQESTNA